MDKKKYFFKLYEYSIDLFNRLPIERTPQPLDRALNTLRPAIDALKQNELSQLLHLRANVELNEMSNESSPGQGLNTLGMLMDRFTILLIKEWSLKNKTNNIKKAEEIHVAQTLDIIEAMAVCRPGSSSMNTKITNIKTNASANSWEEAFYGLLTINLILWESQEVLYIKNISLLPCEELRDYLKWFSWGNMIRNEFIQLCEEYFWKQNS